MQIVNIIKSSIQVVLFPYILIVWIVACVLYVIWEARSLILPACFVLGIFKLLGI